LVLEVGSSVDPIGATEINQRGLAAGELVIKEKSFLGIRQRPQSVPVSFY